MCVFLIVFVYSMLGSLVLHIYHIYISLSLSPPDFEPGHPDVWNPSGAGENCARASLLPAGGV